MSTGYVVVRAPDHPLAGKTGLVTLHRKVLYDLIGPGSHFCHWCGEAVTWTVRRGAGTGKGELVAAHLDGNGLNNTSGNLVPACQRCNIKDRGYSVKDEELFIVRPNGTRLRAEKRICTICDEEFPFANLADKRPNRGKTCSPSCARKLPRKSRTPEISQDIPIYDGPPFT